MKENKNVISLLQDLIRIRSYSGEEAQVVNRIKQAFKSLAYDDVFVDVYGNIIGHIKGKKLGKKILLDGHMDTVSVQNISKWSQNPFGADIVGGKIYGRGASDMKAALCAMINAGSFFAEDMNKEFAGDIYVAGVVHEECFEGVAARKISERVKPNYVVIGEASEINLKIGLRGRAEIVIETYGKPAHSANPENGINAVYKMSKLIEIIRNIDMTHDDFLGNGILELTDIKSSLYPGTSVVPDYCRATYDWRLFVGETKESVLKPIYDIILKMEKEDPKFKAKAYYAKGEEKCYTGSKIGDERFFPGWKFNENEEFIQNVYCELKNVGLNPEIAHYSFCTNGSHYAGEKGINTIGFGPSPENLAHTIDEYVQVEELLKATEGYVSIIKGLFK